MKHTGAKTPGTLAIFFCTYGWFAWVFAAFGFGLFLAAGGVG